MANHNRLEPVVMLVTNTLQDSPTGGRELLCKLNHDALRDIFGECLVLLELPTHRARGVKSVMNAFRGHIDGLNAKVIGRLLQTIQKRSVTKVFVDGSNLGEVVRAVKQRWLNEISRGGHKM